MQSQLNIKAEHLSTFSLAAQQNAYPLFHNLSLHYPTLDNELSEPQETLNQLVVQLTSGLTPNIRTLS